MNVALVCAYSKGGVFKFTEQLCNLLNQSGVEAKYLCADAEGGIPLEELQAVDVVHFVSSRLALDYYTTLKKPTIVTVFGMALEAVKFYTGIIELCSPKLVHVVDHFTQRQLGLYGVYNTRVVPEVAERIYHYIPTVPDEFTLGYIGGDARYRRFDIIEKIAHEAGVKCHGIVNEDGGTWLNDAEMLEFYTKISCYAVASFYEGGPRTAIEAWMCGRPILSTYVGQMPHYAWTPGYGRFFDGSVSNGVIKLKEIIANYDFMRSRLYAVDGLDGKWAHPDNTKVDYCKLYQEALELSC